MFSGIDKAWIGGFLGTWLATAIVAFGEKITGLDITGDVETWIATAITSILVGSFVWAIPNK